MDKQHRILKIAIVGVFGLVGATIGFVFAYNVKAIGFLGGLFSGLAVGHLFMMSIFRIKPRLAIIFIGILLGALSGFVSGYLTAGLDRLSTYSPEEGLATLSPAFYAAVGAQFGFIPGAVLGLIFGCVVVFVRRKD